jgi:hypothetical protein
LEDPIPSQAGHLISATASFDLSLFIKIALQKEPWYPSRSRTPTPFPPSAILGTFLVSAKKRKRAAGNPRDGFTDALFWLERNTSCGQVWSKADARLRGSEL